MTIQGFVDGLAGLFDGLASDRVPGFVVGDRGSGASVGARGREAAITTVPAGGAERCGGGGAGAAAACRSSSNTTSIGGEGGGGGAGATDTISIGVVGTKTGTARGVTARVPTKASAAA
jgi:hypothetical protein